MPELDFLKYPLIYIWEKLLPWFYSGVIEIETLKKMYDWLFSVLMSEHNKTIKNINPYTADEYGIYIFELIYDIKSDPTEDLELRRWRVINYIGMQPPYTYRFLEKHLNDLIGDYNYEMSIDVQGNVLNIGVSQSLVNAPIYYKEIFNFLMEIKPAVLLLNLYLKGNQYREFWVCRYCDSWHYKYSDTKIIKLPEYPDKEKFVKTHGVMADRWRYKSFERFILPNLKKYNLKEYPTSTEIKIKKE